jgi:hypothetical protein
LHAGAPARDIVHSYVCTIRVLREIDPSGELQAKALSEEISKLVAAFVNMLACW